ncbi:hypothetical protein NEOLEDRAFT_1108091 [Neolentinus lepideus HHB14362 ss-1]|uniref:Postreplication repair E3 ubiquitin-protein ligase RAD18 n=1 Tax=Neolentinus lepideus HHB14362 ss-1 TaxID=1314782 RepID=A0A165UT77_9AGAM|nr:hypothetical protein NEOLEDRAFT_1108091 [Neolentinus lepideus HHB14362 ss-1]
MSSDALERWLASDVHDPSDFPKSASALRDLDASLRCNICGELYNAPVTLTCGHCFCSVCVREAIQVKAECPTCRKQTNESHIRSNPQIEAAVDGWKSSRALVLRLCLEEETRHNAPPFTTKAAAESRKKRKLSPDSASNSTTPEVSAGRTDGSTSSSQEVTVIDSEELVDCPMCTKRVQMKRINTHIDSGCRSPLRSDDERPRSKGAQKNAWSKILDRKGKGKERDDDWTPVPKASYQVLKDKQVKDLLIDQQLPTTGDRNAWIARHQRWVLIWNANLDQQPKQRKTISELRIELKRWEETRSKAKKAPEVDSAAAYEIANKAQFDRLIAAARPKKSGKIPRQSVHSPDDDYSSTKENDVIVLD